MEQQPTAQPQAQVQPKPVAYEFSAAQNQTIRVLASRMKFVGIIYVVIAGLFGIGGMFLMLADFLAALVILLEAVFFVLIGLWTHNAAKSFQMIVDTKGHDIGYLMNALESIRKLYNLQFWLMIVMLAVVAVGLVLAVGLSMFEAASMG